MAAVFAVARAEQEGDDRGMVISFRAGDGWKVDPQFPQSYMRKEPVPPGDILVYTIMNPSEDLAAPVYQWLKDKVKELDIKIG